MDNQKLCPSCMKTIADIETRTTCPYCNYDLKATAIKPYHLKPYTMLGEGEKRYMVGRSVGEGAFGVTYVGYDTKLEMKVAIKEFYPKKFANRDNNVTSMVELYQQKSFDIEALREDTINEAKNLAKLDKLDGVVEVKDYFRDNNTIYIVMEYIDGATLKTYLANNGGKIPVAVAKQMIKPVMGSLIKVHESGMIHRDISPDNIMVTAEGKMKLIDFGTAKEEQDNDKVLLGKGGYAPIEQYSRGGNQGPWTDVYALAATFYNCITGQKPPAAKERVQNDTIKSPRQYGVYLGEMEESALMTALNVNPNDRFQNMKALYNAFYTQEEPVAAQPQPVQPQMQIPQPVQIQPQAVNNQPYYQAQPVQPVQPQMQQPIIQQPQYSKPAKKSKGSSGFIILLALIVVAAVAVGGFFMIRNRDDDGDSKSAHSSKNKDDDDEDKDDSADDESTLEETANAELLGDIQDLLDEGKYEDAIGKLIDNEDEFEDEEMDVVGSLTSSAIEGLIKTASSDADGYVSQDNYSEALTSLTNMQDYIASISDDELVKNYADTSSLEDKYNSVTDKYWSYISNSGMKLANSGNDEAVDTMFADADNYFEGDAYTQLKNKVYTYLVIANANKYIADGTNLSEGIEYVRNNVEKTGYNCWVIEYLDVLREQYRVQNNQSNMTATLRNVTNGYILPNSNTTYLQESNLANLSQYELYLAYFEIYARHGRVFSDSVVNEYFSGLSWYNGKVDQMSFDESDLNEYEKRNATLIYEYQVKKGYR